MEEMGKECVEENEEISRLFFVCLCVSVSPLGGKKKGLPAQMSPAPTFYCGAIHFSIGNLRIQKN